jgi:hypothetical protein
MGFVVDMAALGQVFLQDHGISPVIIIPPVLHLLAAVIGRKKTYENWELSKLRF